MRLLDENSRLPQGDSDCRRREFSSYAGNGLTAEYCASVWCRSAHNRLIDSVLNDALRIVTGCLRPTPTDHLHVLSGIQPAEIC